MSKQFKLAKRLWWIYLFNYIFSIVILAWFIVNAIKSIQDRIPHVVTIYSDFVILGIDITCLMLMIILIFQEIHDSKWKALETKVFYKYHLAKIKHANRYHIENFAKVLFITYAIATLAILTTCFSTVWDWDRSNTIINILPTLNILVIIFKLIYNKRAKKLIFKIYEYLNNN
jgi:hypothetical protein